MGNFGTAFEKAAKQFPYSAETVLKKEARELKKQIMNAYVGSTIKSKRKNWKKSLKKKTQKPHWKKVFLPET